MIKLCCAFILPYIIHIINSCLLEHTFPEPWKHALVKPLPKTRQLTTYKDLRPISILPAFSKILERIIHSQLSGYINTNNILPLTQSGLRKGYSCTTALLKVTDDILSATDQGKITILVLLDFSKAFETVDHGILISVLKYMGVNREALSLIDSYLRS